MMVLRKWFLSVLLCAAVFFSSAGLVQALGLVGDGQGAYYASDNQNFLLIDKSSMGPEHDMWSLLDLSTCSIGTWNGQRVVFGKVYMVMDAADSCTDGPSFGYTFFSNGVYHAPGGSYQSISGSNAYRAAKVIFDRASGSSSAGNKSNGAVSKTLLPDEEIAIGGICPYTATPEYVRSIYGEPDKLSKGNNHDGYYYEHWTYGNSFELWFWEYKGKLSVQLVKTTAANGLATPKGIKVGSRETEVLEKYGNPYIPKNGSLWYKGRNGCDFVFSLENGVVTSIGAGWND